MNQDGKKRSQQKVKLRRNPHFDRFIDFRSNLIFDRFLVEWFYRSTQTELLINFRSKRLNKLVQFELKNND